MDETLTEKCGESDCSAWWYDVMARLEAVCEGFGPLDACQAAYGMGTQNTPEYHCLAQSMEPHEAWDLSLPTQDGLRHCWGPSLSDSNSSPGVMLGAPYPSRQNPKGGLSSLAPQISHDQSLRAESLEFWPDAQWSAWSSNEANRNPPDASGFQLSTWPVAPDLNFDQSHFDSHQHLSQAGKWPSPAGPAIHLTPFQAIRKHFQG